MNSVEARRNHIDNIASLSRQLFECSSFGRASWFLNRIAWNEKHVKRINRELKMQAKQVAKLKAKRNG